MSKAIKVEMWKATHNIYFLIALAVGFVLVLCNVYETYTAVQEITLNCIDAQSVGVPITNFTGCSLFVWWIANNGFNFGSTYFYLIWPILAAMPFGWSFAQESRNGCIYQYITRSNRKKYLAAKYVAIFVSGGLAISLPVLADLLINATICPDDSLLFMNALTTIENSSFLSALFYTHPWVHSLIWCVIEFFWGGSVAVLSFVGGAKLRFSVTAMLIPFVILYVLGVLGVSIIRLTGTSLMLNPLYLAMSAPSGTNPGWLIFSVMGLCGVVSLIFGYWQVVKSDLL